MQIIKKYWIYIGCALMAVTLIVVGMFIQRSLQKENDEGSKITVEEGRVVNLKTLAELCSMEFYRESTVLDTINSKVIFGIQKQQGSIVFDLSSLPEQIVEVCLSNDTIQQDTLYLELPKEQIEVHESTAQQSWRVIDSKSLRLFGSSRLSPEEENIVKQRAIEKTRQHLVKDGSVEKARKDGAETLQTTLEYLTGRPVKVRY